MRLKNSVLFDTAFVGAFKKLLAMPFPGITALRLIETFKVLNEQQGNVFAVRDQLIERCAELEDGKAKIENDQIVWKGAEGKTEFEDEMHALIDLDFEIPLDRKIELSNRILISGEDILALKPIIDVNI